ncbi:DNA-directed RNA polymerase [Candidatus Woesearchaeota archaeon]|jgi:DNA-directed RNA polymerase subunit E'|nr:DNA-directed RNA polymerase [Candidatus Woesearchaeota archaeon]MDP6648140.1 DNA-directed RNA polymerase [Candidatus Woesearchaeota archaeon]|tara:strand:- start:93607 stop:94218 length:612 start_codon:yes stop_codon:yes gene_type:complete
MFYKVELKDHIRVPPNLFDLPLEEAVIKRIKTKYNGFISKDLGIVIDVSGMKEIGEGIIIPGDGASYYDVSFELLTFKPEMQEIVIGKIKDIAEFGAFINIGPIDGMIHISQTMDDFVSFSKDKTLAGKESKRVLKVSDVCRARIIAVSFKDILNPKLGLTMRQQGLGRLDWIKEEGQEKAPKKEEKKETKEKEPKDKKKGKK